MDAAVARQFLGGRGYGAKILYDENPPGVDPLAPENRLIFFTSPFMGANVPSAVKCNVITKSPISQTILMTLSGGYFGAELKLTGYDGIVIVGKAKNPVYLEIHNDQARIKDAGYLCGKDCFETQERLKEAFGDAAARVATIGPAGEQLVRFASIINERRAFGRGGAGAVMGSKKLKAIVVRGTSPAKLFDKASFDELVKDIRKRYRESPGVKAFAEYGTTRVVNRVNERGIFPTRNFQFGTFEGASKINGEARSTFVKKRTTCYRCPVGCSAITTVTEGPYSGIESEGPEYETLWSFGALCGNDYLPAIIAAEELCDRYGMDTISTGSAIGFAMECFEKGLITRRETGGIDLRFGNHEGMVEMVRKIGNRESLGDMLAEGVRRAAQCIGGNSHEWAVHIKGLEMSGYDPRGAMGQGLAYATSPRGAEHNRALISEEIFLPPQLADRFTTAGKAKLVKYTQEAVAVVDALGICYFNRDNPMTRKDLAKLYTYATGIEITEEDLLLAGERIFNLERLYNNREGFSRKDDTLPERILNEPFQQGPSAGHTVPIEQLLDEYYQLRGWDSNGFPTSETLVRLGLED